MRVALVVAQGALFAHEEEFLDGLEWFIADERVDISLGTSARSSLEAGV